MKIPYLFLLSGMMFIFPGCQNPAGEDSSNNHPAPGGKLFIIGGGKRPASMVQEMIQLSGLDKGGYGIVLPMSSIEPDTAFFYARRQFAQQDVASIFNFHFSKGGEVAAATLDSIVNARLIYISGGEQVRFMEVVKGTPVYDALHHAYQRGAVIAGTSAGAAVMSKKMITGNEFKHPEYTGDFKTIEADNVELAEGLGLLDQAIIDQHFIKRMRNNRLISVAIENPGVICIGIDEATAIVVEGDSARVTGVSQVIVMKSEQTEYQVQNGLLGVDNIRLGVYLPGDSFRIR